MLKTTMVGIFLAATTGPVAAQTTWEFTWTNFLLWYTDGKGARTSTRDDGLQLYGSFTIWRA